MGSYPSTKGDPKMKNKLFVLSVFMIFAILPFAIAQTPSCGSTISSSVTFDKAAQCDGYYGDVFTIDTSGITIDCSGFGVWRILIG